MSPKISKNVYFHAGRKENTDKTLELAKQRAQALKIDNIVVASTTGATAIKASRVFKGFNLVVVGSTMKTMRKELREKVIDSGAKLFTASHALSGPERAIRTRWGTIGIMEILGDAIREIFGHGVKVSLEITLMAADAGLIPVDKDVIAIAGTHEGADTAIVLQPAHSHDFFNLFVKEIIARPCEPPTG